MNHRPFAVLLVAAIVISLSGCSSTSDSASAGTPPPPSAAQETPAATTGLGAVKDSGDLPDPCTLLTKEQVTGITGREITQVDEDGAESGSATRYCQWQQDNGQLAVFLSRTTQADYELVIDGADPVEGLGEKAFTLSGHLYVLYGTVQLDVYSRGDSDAENLDKSKKVVNILIPKVS